MPAKPQDKALVVCPGCGHQQQEPHAAISSKCRQCGQYLPVQELLNPVAKALVKSPLQRRVRCFECSTEIEVSAAAQSAMCKRCSSYIDLQDYTISNGVSKNFKTKGRFVIEPKGYVFNTSIVAGEIILKGRLIGKVTAEQSLTIFGTAEIKGTFQTPLLIIPAENVFHWREPLRVGAIDICGEVVSHIHAEKTVTIRASGRVFGNVRARDLVVEEGAVLVGQVKVGSDATADSLVTAMGAADRTNSPCT